MLLMCARPLLFEGINVGHVSQSVPPCTSSDPATYGYVPPLRRPMDIRVRRPRSVFVVTRIHRGGLFTAITSICATPFTCADPAVRPQRGYGFLLLLHMCNNVRNNGYGGTAHRRQYGV
jgi:hypothetical protein